MKTHVSGPLFCAAVLAVTGLSTGSPVFLVPALALVLLLVFGLVSVLWTAGTLRMETDLSGRTVTRGDRLTLRVRLRHGCPLPVPAVTLTVRGADGETVSDVRVQRTGRRTQILDLPVYARHVGIMTPGIERCTVSDLFGFFSRTLRPSGHGAELLVEPLTFDVKPLTFSPGDPGLGTMARASEDLTNPADVRGWQPGDPLKKIHWKLSVRRRELMVRRFEEPVLREALVLMDGSDPPDGGEPGREADVRDTLLETSASVIAAQIPTDNTVSMPLYGRHPVELSGGMGLPLILENLARADFSETDRFERVLMLESRRLRRTGSLIIITARLSGAIVETISQMRRMGPHTRLYLVSFQPNRPQWMPFIARLQQAGVEVCYVTPAA